MLTHPEVVDFFSRNPALSVSAIEKESGLAGSTIAKALLGQRVLNEKHLTALEPVLTRYGLNEFRNRKAKVIAVANHKGGVGKTTTTLNLGRALAIKKYRVLVVDLDSQGNLSQCLGVTEPEMQLYEVLGTREPLPVVRITENYDLVPSNIELAKFERELIKSPTGGVYFKAALNPLLKDYDFVLIDCPPALNIFTSSALIAADSVLVVMQPEISAFRGINSLFELIEDTRNFLNDKLSIAGIVLSQVDKRLVIHKEVIKGVRQELSRFHVFRTEIRDTTALKESQYMQKDIFRYHAASTGAEDYLALAQEFIDVI